MEEFRVCFEQYEISNLGNCRRKMIDGTYKTIKGSIMNTGYIYFQVMRDGKRINKLFHQMVAKCFIGDYPEGCPVIDHIDRNKLNNKVENLRYVSHQVNLQNTDKYRSDIIESDHRKRFNLLSQSRYEKRNGGYKYRKRGSGQLSYRPQYNTWRATIGVNKVRHDKSFKSQIDAEEWLKSFNG